MLKILLKKQLAEIFRSYFYDSKKNKKRSPLSTFLFIFLFALLMVVFLGGTFAFVSGLLCFSLVSAGMDWLYFALMGLIAILLGTFGSVFNTYSGLYLSKDNDLLLSFPIPVRCIMSARLLGVYLMGLLYSSVVIIPAVIVYWITAPFTFLSVAGSVLLVLLISVIVLILSCLLGWVVAKASLKLKNKSFISVVLSLLFFAAYYFFYYKAQVLINDLLANTFEYAVKIKNAAYPLYALGLIGTGNPTAMFCVSVVVAVIFALMWMVLSRSFTKIATSSGKTSRTEYRETAVKTKSVSGAVLGKEFKRLTSSANYMLNCGLGTVFLFILGVALLLKGGELISGMKKIFEGMFPGSISVLMCSVICMFASMNITAAPSVSLEGRNLWLMQSLPVTPWQVLRSKLYVQLIITGIPVLFCTVCAAIVTPCTLLQFMFPIIYTVFFAFFALSLGVKIPNLTWTNEIVPIKQSAAVMISMFGGWIYIIIFAAGYFLEGFKIGVTVYIALFSLLTAAISVLLYFWLKKRGTKAFAKL